MFMYAAARALSLRIGAKITVDHRSGFKNDSFGRNYELDGFNICGEHASTIESFDYPGGRYFRTLSSKVQRHMPFVRTIVVTENNCLINEIIKNPEPRSYLLDGYWQTDQYFREFSDHIREEFTIVRNLPPNVLNESHEIQKLGNRAVALCVRRYQEVKRFVNLRVTQKDYYMKAIELIRKKIDDPLFVCFSQDQQWVIDNLADEANIIFAEKKIGPASSISDLFLITQFQNIILSNSSFYWWGAWLASHPEKTVISPNNWVNEHTVPDEWIVIPCKAE